MSCIIKSIFFFSFIYIYKFMPMVIVTIITTFIYKRYKEKNRRKSSNFVEFLNSKDKHFEDKTNFTVDFINCKVNNQYELYYTLRDNYLDKHKDNDNINRNNLYFTKAKGTLLDRIFGLNCTNILLDSIFQGFNYSFISGTITFLWMFTAKGSFKFVKEITQMQNFFWIVIIISILLNVSLIWCIKHRIESFLSKRIKYNPFKLK